ncbi:RNA polymerase sigma factor [Longimycelium tulufanense]|uniref:RNA polymerase sigma factor n=1 Tax=Longimycelium tulufanense TaxID=907463 RepID=A0A8J3FXX6_9PSEU|nr:sigma-70 family RNA polymerase sigma factor [Longimycelium tulufanense]GGM71858.1 RNA polymerase sigma factor [Longimycelium tulufanense]
MGRHRITPHARADAEGAGDYDEDLITRLYREFGGPLFGHALKLTDYDRQWAEDVVQETLVRAWRHAPKLDREPGLLRAWLFTVARRIVIDGHRSRRARPEEVDLTRLAVVPVRDDSDRTLSAIVVGEALRHLTQEHREAIMETYLRGRTVKEAAKVLGVPPGTVKSRVYYALRALRQALQERDPT